MKVRSIFMTFAMTWLATTSFAQKITVQEPEFTGTYCILTSDSTARVLPKESGEIKNHQSKVSKWAKIGGIAASAAGAVGGIVGVNASSIGAMTGGFKVMGTAANVGQIADAADALAGASGMDIVFDGPESSYKVPQGTDNIRLLIKGEDNEQDPMEVYRIVRFAKNKKERRIQWMEFRSSLLGAADTEKGGYVNFTGAKYGEKSYLITIPAEEVKKGEYGIFFMSVITATSIPVGTFSVE